MSQPSLSGLLTTKCFVPRVHAEYVTRPRLLKKLDAGLVDRLTIVAAPAGFGKSSVVSHWLQQQHVGAYSWLSLDKDDSDVVRFYGYLQLSLQKISPDLGIIFTPLLRSTPLPSASVVMTALINALSLLEHPTTLVLDDYHLIDNTQIHEALTFLLENSPPHFHLVLISRVDPPLPLARWRARRELTEIRVEDLRFTTEEAVELLNEQMELDLSLGQINELERRTEGWAAALQLATISMQHQNNLDSFIASFNGSHHFVLDYLTDEVLLKQSPKRRDFLLRTAILERFCAPLCATLLTATETVTAQDITQAQQMLKGLEQSNLFVVRLDDERYWYRYHHLFAEMLQQQLRQVYPELVAELHIQASVWFEHNGLIVEAINQALAGKDSARAAQLAADIAQSIVVSGQMQTVLNWGSQIPEDRLRKQPKLCLSYSWALLFTGHLDAVDESLQLLDEQIETYQKSDCPESSVTDIVGEISIIRASLARIKGDVLEMRRFAQKGLSLLKLDDLLLRGVAHLMLGHAYRLCGELDQSKRAYEQANLSSQKMNNPISRFIALGHLIQLAIMTGQFGEALQRYKETQIFIDTLNGHHLPSVGVIEVAVGELFRILNRFDEAETHLQAGIRLCQQWGALAENAITGFISLAYLRQAQQRDGLVELAKAVNVSQPLSDTHWQTRIETQQVKYRLLNNDDNNDFVIHWIARFETEAQSELNLESATLQAIEATLTYARWQMMQANYKGAAERLQRTNEITQRMPHRIFQLESLILLAQVYHLNNHPKALDFLHQAILLAAPQGNLRTWLDEGEAIYALLERASPQDCSPHEAYLYQLLAEFCKAQRPDASQQLADALSDREQEILRLIATGLSNQEIADMLIIAHSTVKTHINHIYNKLEVRSRTQAIARARDLALL